MGTVLERHGKPVRHDLLVPVGGFDAQLVELEEIRRVRHAVVAWGQIRLELSRPSYAAQLSGEGRAARSGHWRPLVMKSLILEVSARCRPEQCRVLARWSRSAVMTCWCGEHTGSSLRTRDLLAPPLLLRRRWTERVPSRGRAPWCQGAFLRGRRLRRLWSCVARAGRGAVQREGWCRGAPCSADELGDVGEPLVVEVIDGTVVQELSRQEQLGVRVRRSATSVGR